YGRMRNTMQTTVKKPHFNAEARNSIDKLEAMHEWFMNWKDKNLNCTKNYASIDGAEFHISKRDNWARSPAKSCAQAPPPIYQVINELADIINEDEDEDLKRSYLVLNNASIHESKPMIRKIEAKGYTVIYLLPLLA
ncbi:hypothetical protein BD408DRAFT_341770, partial [Parasitella parasitica]